MGWVLKHSVIQNYSQLDKICSVVKHEKMSSKKEDIITAAIEIFSRYGVHRTRMGEVAERASVSRQTLYAIFKNKDELMAACMTKFVDDLLAQLAQDWQAAESLSAKLDAYFEHAIFRPFETLQHLPDVRDLLSGVGDETTAVSKQADIEKAARLAEQLEPYHTMLAATGNSPETIAEFVVRAASEFKYNATERSELERLIKTLKSSVLALVGEG